MIKIVKRLVTLLLALGFILISCAATIPPKVTPLGGTPRVKTVGITIGMSLVELDRELGTPHGTASCALSFEAEGKQAKARGREFMWEYEFTDIPTGTFGKSKITVCTLDGIIVRDHREGQEIRGNLSMGYNYYIFNLPLVQTIMENLLKSRENKKILPGDYNKEFEI